MRRGGLTAWGSTLVLAAVGSQLAHALDYRIVTPHEHERAELLATTGHGYLGYAPLALALGFGLLLAVLATEVRRSVHRPGARPRAWSFALVAPVVFVVQEHLERFAHDGVFPWSAALDNTFLLGLVLQVPFALAAYLLARLLLSAARAVGRLLADRRRPGHAGQFALTPPRIDARVPRVPALALGYGERGPPAYA